MDLTPLQPEATRPSVGTPSNRDLIFSVGNQEDYTIKDVQVVSMVELSPPVITIFIHKFRDF